MQKPEWEQKLPAGYRMATEVDRGTPIGWDWKAWTSEWEPIRPNVVGKPLDPWTGNGGCHVPMCMPIPSAVPGIPVNPRPCISFPGMSQENEDAMQELASMVSQKSKPPLKPFTPNKYTRWMSTLDGRKVPVDVYCVLAAFPTGSSAVDHAVKKQLAPGQRGHKDRIQDLKEARDSLTRAIELEEAVQG